MLREATLEMCDDARFFTNTFEDYDGKDELLSSERKVHRIGVGEFGLMGLMDYDISRGHIWGKLIPRRFFLKH